MDGEGINFIYWGVGFFWGGRGGVKVFYIKIGQNLLQYYRVDKGFCKLVGGSKLYLVHFKVRVHSSQSTVVSDYDMLWFTHSLSLVKIISIF